MLATRKEARIALLLPLLLAAAGCGGSGQLPRAQVSGEVTLDGKPVDSARLIFRPANGRAGRGDVKDGKIVSAGTYDMTDGVVLGTHKIAVQPVVQDAPVLLDRMAEEEDAKPAKKRQRAQQPAYAAKPTGAKIPHKYTSPDTSGLTTEIVAGENTLELKLTSQ